ncbi:hypothetical protein CLU79DRAFT_778131 [Phycomyces nitens]|nr:hypothetical protein CLU79DRAFT_778131 [Phycomyces nitens]
MEFLAKKLSPYNKFMKTELAKVKEAQPGIAHKEAFKQAAQNWSKSSDNPKNKEAAPAEK